MLELLKRRDSTNLLQPSKHIFLYCTLLYFRTDYQNAALTEYLWDVDKARHTRTASWLRKTLSDSFHPFHLTFY